MSNTIRHTQMPVPSGEFHVAEAGDPSGDPMLLLHGWPEDWSEWSALMERADADKRLIAVDLPGIGESRLDDPEGNKDRIARDLHELVEAMNLTNLTVVGHDAGGMVAYSYLRQFHSELNGVAILDTVIPGVAPWDEVQRNPYLWHFAFHSIPNLPEILVGDHTRAYYDFFFDALTADSASIDEAARERYVRAYARPETLAQGFELYRSFFADAEFNRNNVGPIDTPTVYVRGEHEGGSMESYESGLRSMGISNLEVSVIPNAGHFTPEEAPDAVWSLLARFASPA